MKLDGLAVGVRVLVSGEMDPATGRARTRSITPVTLAVADSPDAPHLLEFVRRILDELGETDVPCDLASVDEHAAIRLWLPDEIGKEIQLSRRMLEWALVESTARRTVRSVLQTGISILRSRRALDAMGEAPYQCRVDGTTSADPQCTQCGQPMTEVSGEVEDFRQRRRTRVDP
jgi:hypothetical protein